MDQRKIGSLMRELRKEKNLTQEQLAENFHVTGRSVSRWENGSNLPELEILIALADFYEIDLRDLLNGERKQESSEDELKETVKQAADYSRLKERSLLRHVTAIVGAGCVAWGISLITMLLFLNNVTGGTIVLGISLGGLLLYFLLTAAWKTNRTTTGYLNSLIGGFSAVTAGNLSLLLLFFREGNYKNYGLIGMWYCILLFLGVFLMASLLVTLANRKLSRSVPADIK